MVRIVNYKEHQREDGTTFCLLELQGGIEMVQSQTTGSFYATAKKAWVSSTFDELTCQALIGTEMPGKIIKQECDVYEYTIKETGEEILLSHRWVYVPEESNVPGQQKTVPINKTEELQPNVEAFSKNGVPELEEQFA